MKTGRISYNEVYHIIKGIKNWSVACPFRKQLVEALEKEEKE